LDTTKDVRFPKTPAFVESTKCPTKQKGQPRIAALTKVIYDLASRQASDI
jgi:hypothetical protein